MSVKIYDSTIGAFKDAETPLIWDEQAQAWKDSVGLVWNESAQAWEERWKSWYIVYDEFAESTLDLKKWQMMINGSPSWNISNGLLSMYGSGINTVGIMSAYSLTGKEKYIELEYLVTKEGGSYKENMFWFMQDSSVIGFNENGALTLISKPKKVDYHSFMKSTYPGHNGRFVENVTKENTMNNLSNYITANAVNTPYLMKFVYEDGMVTLYINNTKATQFSTKPEYIIGSPVFIIATGNYNGANKDASISIDWIKMTIKD